MSTTKLQLRRAVEQDIAGDMYLLGTVNYPTATTINVAEFADAGGDAKRLVDRWTYIPSSGEERRIVGFDTSSGKTTINRSWTTTPTQGDTVELHRWRPSLMHQAINDGLKRCKYKYTGTQAAVANTTSYPLSASFSEITDKRDIYNVGYILGSVTASTAVIQPFNWYDVQNLNGIPTLMLGYTVPSIGSSGAYIAIEYKRPYPSLTLDTDTTDCPLDWARVAARVALYDILLPRVSPGKERSRLEIDRIDAYAKFRRLSRLYQPNEAKRIETSGEYWGPRYLSTNR